MPSSLKVVQTAELSLPAAVLRIVLPHDPGHTLHTPRRHLSVRPSLGSHLGSAVMAAAAFWTSKY